MVESGLRGRTLLGLIVHGFELSGRNFPDRLEEPAVVEPTDPLERHELDLLDAAPRAARTDHLGLVEAVDRLGQGVASLKSLDPLSLLARRAAHSARVDLGTLHPVRSASVEQQSFCAIERIISQREPYRLSCSNTIQTARSRSSWDSLPLAAFTPSSREWSLRQTRGGSLRRHATHARKSPLITTRDPRRARDDHSSLESLEGATGGIP